MKVHVTACFIAKDGEADALRRLAVQLVEPIRNDPGCLRCHLVANVDDPAEITYVEEWASREALDAHLQDPFVAEVVGRMNPLLAEPFSLKVHTEI